MIWLIGNRGMLGQELSGLMDSGGIDYVGTDREVDIRDPQVLRDFAAKAASGEVAGVKAGKIEWIINCSAYTAVDKAEEEEAVAFAINATGAGNIARVANEIGARMIHISTDYVFDGDGIKGADGQLRPYLEDDVAKPAGAYGRTKLAGEELVRENCPGHFIIRTAWLYGLHGPNFVYTMLRLMRTKESVGVVCDQHGSPTWARDLTKAMLTVVDVAGGTAGAGTKTAYGTYHFTNSGKTNWHVFAAEIERLGRETGILERPCTVNPLTSDQYPSKTKRPAWSVLSKDKLIALGAEVPDWKASLGEFMEALVARRDEMIELSGHAVYDLETARAMLASGRYLYVLHCGQQAIEKLLKTLVCLRQDPPRIHGLARIAAMTSLPFTDAQTRLLENLTAFYLKGRYEHDVKELAKTVDSSYAGTVMESVEAVCAMISKHPLFSIL